MPRPRDEEQAEKRQAVLQYVLRVPDLGENGGMLADVFMELMEMIAPRWDCGDGGVGAGGQGQGEVCVWFWFWFVFVSVDGLVVLTEME